MARRKKRSVRKAPKRAVSSGESCAPGGSKCWGWLILIVGVLLLLQDLGQWDFWGINWWTLAFLAVGLHKLCAGYKGS